MSEKVVAVAAGVVVGGALTYLLTRPRPQYAKYADLLEVVTHRVDAAPGTPVDIKCTPKYMGYSRMVKTGTSNEVLNWEFWVYVASFERPDGSIKDDVELFVGITVANNIVYYECARHSAQGVTIKLGTQTYEFENLMPSGDWTPLFFKESPGYMLLSAALAFPATALARRFGATRGFLQRLSR